MRGAPQKYPKALLSPRTRFLLSLSRVPGIQRIPNSGTNRKSQTAKFWAKTDNFTTDEINLAPSAAEPTT